MRITILLRILSRVLLLEALILAFPLGLSIFWGESIWWVYLVGFALSGGLGAALAATPAVRDVELKAIRRREGMAAVTLSWLILGFFTALSFYLSGVFESFAGAFFESVSGYTTTGASVMRDIEAAPASIPFLRGFSQWIGGMGVIVLSVAILPELAVGGMQLFSAESSGIDSDKLAPRIQQTARRLWTIYFGFTVVETLLLVMGGMSPYDALLHSFASVATGGFSNRNASVAYYDSAYLEMVIAAFMWLSAISFSLMYRSLVDRKPLRIIRSEEVRLFLFLNFGAVVLITWNLYGAGGYDSLGTAIRYGVFQVSSVGSTTGFATADFDKWPELSRTVLLILMIVGGCAGSTAGGLKAVRIHVLIQHARVQLRKLVRPRLVQTIRLGRRTVTEEMIQGMMGFFLLYFAVVAMAMLVLTAMDLNVLDAFSAVISCLNSFGPGFGVVGPMANYADLHAVSLWTLSACMLLGRLELFTVLVIFSGHFWRKG